MTDQATAKTPLWWLQFGLRRVAPWLCAAAIIAALAVAEHIAPWWVIIVPLAPLAILLALLIIVVCAFVLGDQ